MNIKVIVDFLSLAALWGGSFLLMRVASPEFGPFALSGVRVFIAGLVLFVLLMVKKRGNALVQHWKPIATVGLINSAGPFLFFAYAMAHISSGLGAILNATVPLWGAIVAFVWLKDRIVGLRVLGLFIGFIGVIFLVWNKVSFKPGSGLAASATGSQLSAAVILFPLGIFFWPDHAVSLKAWAAVFVLAVFCTALAYILYFRLFAVLGPSKTITVTFLIPVFGMAWGGIVLQEIPTMQMVIACAIIILGTSLSAGVLGHRKQS
jgi:drug/metabolite transporter (DMT)-like permease